MPVLSHQRQRQRRKNYILALASTCIWMPLLSTRAQVNTRAAQTFPYTFTNFVWWSDADLRGLIMERVPGLTDVIGRNSPMEDKLRLELEHLLTTKGINAKVQIIEPSSTSMHRVPEAPPESIEFSIAEPPRILTGKVTIDGATTLINELNQTAAAMEGRTYNSNSFWSRQSQLRDALTNAGYLDAVVVFRPGNPEHDTDGYRVPLSVVVKPGPQFHVSAVAIDGGPLLQGRDLAEYVHLKPGEVANISAFGRLANMQRVKYWTAGYADVGFDAHPSIDSTKATVAYKSSVIPGPMYQLGALTIKNLKPEQETEARDMLGIKPGDVYDAYAVATLNGRLKGSLSGYDLTYSPRKDPSSGRVDLTLDFFKR